MSLLVLQNSLESRNITENMVALLYGKRRLTTHCRKRWRERKRCQELCHSEVNLYTHHPKRWKNSCSSLCGETLCIGFGRAQALGPASCTLFRAPILELRMFLPGQWCGELRIRGYGSSAFKEDWARGNKDRVKYMIEESQAVTQKFWVTCDIIDALDALHQSLMLTPAWTTQEVASKLFGLAQEG